ncbi:MAG: universal stress protein [Planctomycetota bacterium]|nr:MAG: universal stress protein [Planctomycetota bacterium]
MKVLIGVDGSPASFAGVSLVGRLLDQRSDEVAIYFSPAELHRRMPWGQTLLEGASAALFNEAESRLPQPFTRKVEAIVSTKSAAAGILEAALGWRADLVVVGASNTMSLEKVLLGSVSRAVVHGAQLPVLVVRNPPPENQPIRALACHHPASAAAVAAIAGKLHWPAESSGEVIGVAESLLAGPLPAWLEKKVRHPDTEAIAVAWQQEHDNDVGALGARLTAFQETLPPVFRGCPPILVQGNPGDQIRAHVRDHGDNLVIIGRTPTDQLTRWLLGSTSEAVLTGVPASVLLVPVEKS